MSVSMVIKAGPHADYSQVYKSIEERDAENLLKIRGMEGILL